jgi:chromosome segregation ATPase
LETSHNERQEKIPSTEDYQKQIEQLQQNLSENEKERNALSERLSEVELELRKTIDEHESTMSQYESLLEARDTLGEQAPLHSAER